MENGLKRADIFKICVLGSTGVGKTSIINRIVNHSFSQIYEPTYDITNYSVLLNIADDETKEKIYIQLILEDIFGLNNPLLQTTNELIKSPLLQDKRKKMVGEFKNIICTSGIQKKQKDEMKNASSRTSLSVSNIFERNGFIIVLDLSEPSSLEDAKFILRKLTDIEKSNGASIDKCIFVNKSDVIVEKKRFKEMLNETELIKKLFNCESYIISAKTNENLTESYMKFLKKIYTKSNKNNNINNNEEERFDIPNIEMGCSDTFVKCGKRVDCGGRMFSCGVIFLLIKGQA